MQTAKASRKQSSLSGKESAQGCIPKRLLGRPDEALGGGNQGPSRELPRVPLRGEGSCGGGGAPRDSAGSGATEEGLTSTRIPVILDYYPRSTTNWISAFVSALIPYLNALYFLCFWLLFFFTALLGILFIVLREFSFSVSTHYFHYELLTSN